MNGSTPPHHLLRPFLRQNLPDKIFYVCPQKWNNNDPSHGDSDPGGSASNHGGGHPSHTEEDLGCLQELKGSIHMVFGLMNLPPLLPPSNPTPVVIEEGSLTTLTTAPPQHAIHALHTILPIPLISIHPTFIKLRNLERLKDIAPMAPWAGVLHSGMSPKEALQIVTEKSPHLWNPLEIFGLPEEQKNIIQNEKMVSIGRLTKNMAHHLQQPLEQIDSLCQQWLKRCQDGSTTFPTLESDLKEVQKANQRIQKIIENLLKFIKSPNHHLEIHSLSQLVQDTLPILDPLLKPFHCHLEIDKTKKDTLWVQPDLFKQVIFNLVHNACQASQVGSSLHIRTSQPCPQWLYLEIQDFGSGIPHDQQLKIFHPFFTTKNQGQGTGLGLSISKKIVESFHGKIHVQSTVGQGTTFQVQLPSQEHSPLSPKKGRQP